MRLKLLLFLIISFIPINAIALEFSVILTPEEQAIKINQTATYDIWITHDSQQPEMFEVYSPEISWDIRTNKLLQVLPKKTFKGTITIRPMNVNPGMYLLPLIFKSSRTGQTVKKTLPISIQAKSKPGLKYLPAVKGVADIDYDIDPRKGMTIRIQIENQNKRDLSTVNIKVRSKTINKDYTTSLAPLEKKLVTFKANLPLNVPPQKDALQVSIIVPENNKAYQFDLKPKVFEIIPISWVEEKKTETKKFMKTIHTIIIENKGNIKQTHEYTEEMPFYKKIFAKANIKGENTKQGKKYKIELKPGETKKLEITYNYRPIIWLLILAAILLGSYYYFRKPIIIKKSAKIETTQEEGKGQLKILLELKNRSKKTIKKVKLMDLISNLAEYVEDGTITLQPTKITKHEYKGTLLTWEIGNLEPGEQRIITYRIKSKLNIIGGLTLPVAAVKYQDQGQEKETTSNKPKITFE
ncbi:hypothetical protein DRJ22_02865 [Candidatus Woesearchaeota archaeon]|nr:MAG: hypothetical protein DRJ22_02865 [Candidatus Woesearchaeota archaeon]